MLRDHLYSSWTAHPPLYMTHPGLYTHTCSLDRSLSLSHTDTHTHTTHSLHDLTTDGHCELHNAEKSVGRSPRSHSSISMGKTEQGIAECIIHVKDKKDLTQDSI